MPPEQAAYEPLLVRDPTDRKSVEGLSESESLYSDKTISKSGPALHRRAWLMHIGIFTVYTITFLTLSAMTIRRSSDGQNEAWLLKQSMYSPVLDALEFSVVKFNGSLEHPSIYSGPRTPAVEEAWNRITTNNSLWPLRLSDEELERIDKDGRASNVRYKEADGGGSMATLGIFHQLHCLRSLREYTYPKDYPDVQELWKTRPQFLRLHIDHCIDMIRQNLMCNADVTVVTYDWITGWKVPFPDFSAYHKCKNFDGILDWMSANRVHIPQQHMTRIGVEVDLPEWHSPD